MKRGEINTCWYEGGIKSIQKEDDWNIKIGYWARMTKNDTNVCFYRHINFCMTSSRRFRCFFSSSVAALASCCISGSLSSSSSSSPVCMPSLPRMKLKQQRKHKEHFWNIRHYHHTLSWISQHHMPDLQYKMALITNYSSVVNLQGAKPQGHIYRGTSTGAHRQKHINSGTLTEHIYGA